jgi:acyl-CoA synthetase (AMP-forming)/AMP-acid ligase II
MDLRRLIDEACERHAARVALRCGEAECTYADLAQRVRELGARLAGLGLVPGDRLAACLTNGPAYLELYLACARGGLVLVPLNLRLHALELRAILDSAEPRLCLHESNAGSSIALALAERDDLRALCVATDGGGPLHAHLPDPGASPAALQPALAAGDCAQLYYTSGTTGRPKGVVLTHGNVAAHAAAALVEFELTAQDVWGHFAPMFHLADAWAVFAVTLAGGRHAFLPAFDAADAFATIEREGVSATNLVPTMLQRMVNTSAAARASVESLRLVLSGGAPIAPELVRRVQELFGCEYVQTYGLTETSPFLTVSRIDAEIAALDEERQFFYRSRTGRPFGGIELRVVGEDGAEVARDGRSVGEIHARGAWVFPRYWRAPEETRAAFEDGWFKTGDLATVEERGYLNIVDRKKDVILCGGETIYSTEVENALYSHHLVEAAAVFPMADEEWGEVVAAAVVRRAEAGERRLELGELLGHCRLFLAGYKLPRAVFFVDELPLSGSGKVQKRVLRERCRGLRPEGRRP